MKIRVLFVDDEPKLLEGLQRSLRPLRSEWETRFAGSGEEALAILAVSKFDALVTDMRMPGLDGIGLLKAVAQKYPGLLRIVLSGQSDLESLVQVSGVAHQYLAKPCSLDTLKEAIVHAFAVNENLNNPQLRSLISGITTLPSLAQSFLELTAAIDSPTASVSEIGEIISRDLAMSSKVLQLMNSAFFGRSRKITDPAEAVSYLGTGTVRALATAVYAFRSFESEPRARFDMQQLWTHSIECGGLAGQISKAIFPGQKEMHDLARTAGLLHDIGRLVLACKLPEQAEAVTHLAKEKSINLWEAEVGLLGVSHAEIGAYLLAFWGLPSRIVEAVAYHHLPSDCVSQEFSALGVVHIANSLLRQSATKTEYAAPMDDAYLNRTGYAQKFAEERESWSALLGVPA